MQNNIAEIKIRCERKIGEFSRELPKEQGFAHSPNDKENVTKTKILSDANLSIKNINTFEAIADIPVAAFEEHIQNTKHKKQELTTAGTLKLAKEIQIEKNREQKAELW